MSVTGREVEREQGKRQLMRQYIEEDQRMRAEYRDRDRERQLAEEQRIAAFAREQAQRDEERQAVKSAQNEERDRLQHEVIISSVMGVKNVRGRGQKVANFRQRRLWVLRGSSQPLNYPPQNGEFFSGQNFVFWKKLF